MARVEGFEPAQSGQSPVDDNGNPVAVGVWGDSSSGVGVFATSGPLSPGVDNIPMVNIAAAVGHSISDAGVWGESRQDIGVVGRSTLSHGVLGVTFAPTIPNQPPEAHGVFGVSVAGGNGVVGLVGDATGVVGNSIRGTGVRGLSGTGPGVVGESASSVWPGVLGRNPAGMGVAGEGDIAVLGSSGTRFGVVGVSAGQAGVLGSSGTGTGVLGESFAAGESGVLGRSRGGSGVVGESAADAGVLGRGIGILAGESADAGVRGVQFSVQGGTGVDGTSVLGTGVEGLSFGAVGVRGQGRDVGVHGVATSTNDRSAAGILGEKLGDPRVGFAGLFLGNVGIAGNLGIAGSLSKAGGGFEIDHPLDPANRYLRHSFVESPEMLNVYSGNVTTDANGAASVELPDYFEALNSDFRYQLTVLGQFAQAIVAEEIENNRFTIRTDQPQVKVSWQVTGIRRDPWAVRHRIAVDAEKAEEEKGRYLHPELWGQPEETRMARGGDRDHEQSRAREHQLRHVRELVPDDLRDRMEQHLQALQRGDHVDRGELVRFAAAARQRTTDRRALDEDPRIGGEPPSIDRARLEGELRRAEELLQHVRRSLGGDATS